MQNIELRHKTLLKILSEERVYSQEELLLKLRLQGIESTQATLSRDLRALKVTKTPGEGYRLPNKSAAQPHKASLGASGMLSLEISGQMGVIKTRTGFAPSVAVTIDSHPSYPIMGTLAGDDTLLIIIRQGQRPEMVLKALALSYPDIETIYQPDGTPMPRLL